jgi:hypothetical protein
MRARRADNNAVAAPAAIRIQIVMNPVTSLRDIREDEPTVGVAPSLLQRAVDERCTARPQLQDRNERASQSVDDSSCNV